MKDADYSSWLSSNAVRQQKAPPTAKSAEIQDTEIAGQEGYSSSGSKVLPQKGGGFIFVYNYTSPDYDVGTIATKFNASGKKVKTLSIPGKSIVSQNGDNIYVGSYNIDTSWDNFPHFFLQKFDSNLEKDGAQIKLGPDFDTSIGIMQSIAITNSGEIVVLHIITRSEYHQKLFIQKFDSTGAKLLQGAGYAIDAVYGITETSPLDHFFSIEAIALPNGEIAVSWEKADGNRLTTDINLQRFDANLFKVGGRIQQNITPIAEDTISVSGMPFLKVLGNEGYIFGLTKATRSKDSQESRLEKALLTKYDLDSNQLASYTIESALVYGSGCVTTLENGNIVVAFGRLNSNNGLQVFDAKGNKLGKEIIIGGQLQLGPIEKSYSSVTALNNGEIIVTHPEKESQKIFAERFSSKIERLAFVTSPIFTVEGLGQKLSFDQVSSIISFKDIIIYPLSPSDKFKVTMTLKRINANGAEEVVTDEDILLIQQESMDEDGVGSEFSNGTLTAKGTAEQIKKSLQDLKIEIGENFLDPENDVRKIFSVEISVEDKTNHQIKTGEIYADYQYLELPQELIKIIRDQKSKKEQALVMDFARIYYKPEDPKFQTIIQDLNQTFDNSNTHSDRFMDIKKLRKTAFEIFGTDIDNITLSLETQQHCREIISRDFKLNPQLTSSAESKDSSTNINYGIGAGGTLLFTALACLAYKKFIARDSNAKTPGKDVESPTASAASKTTTNAGIAD